MTNLVFFYNPMSRARVVRWMLEEVGVPYETRLVRFDNNQHKSAEFLAINPMGKLPAIKHGDTVVTEVAAICAYLADAFPAAQLAPPTSSFERGTYYRWMFFGSGCFEPAFTNHAFKRPPVDRPSAIGYGTYEDTLNTLEKALARGPFLLGERFSAADVFVGSQIGWAMMTKAIEPRPVFEQYLTHCGARPANQRAKAQDEKYMQELMPKA